MCGASSPKSVTSDFKVCGLGPRYFARGRSYSTSLRRSIYVKVSVMRSVGWGLHLLKDLKDHDDEGS